MTKEPLFRTTLITAFLCKFQPLASIPYLHLVLLLSIALLNFFDLFLRCILKRISIKRGCIRHFNLYAAYFINRRFSILHFKVKYVTATGSVIRNKMYRGLYLRTLGNHPPKQRRAYIPSQVPEVWIPDKSFFLFHLIALSCLHNKVYYPFCSTGRNTYVIF